MEKQNNEEGIRPMMTHTGTLHSLLFPSAVWRMPSRKIFLTFDDGPHPEATAKVLDVLQRNGVRATFFLTGSNIPGNERLVRRIAADGHAIGIHAYHHSRLLALSKERTKKEILQTQSALTAVTGQPIRLFRPPFGVFSWNTIAAARELNYVLVMWSCLTGDFKQWPTEKTVATAMHRLSAGSILVFHDNDLTNATIEKVLDRTISAVRAKGFEFGAIR